MKPGEKRFVCARENELVLYFVKNMMLDFDSAYQLIQRYDTITIFGHAMPDGDCYGSQIALREMILAAFPNKKVYAVGSGLPAFFERISPMDEVSDETIKESLAILVDVSCLRRVEDPRVFTAKDFMKFDHHQPNKELEAFDGLSIVDPARIAAAEILTEFALYEGWPISKKAAECLYLGICTDSGHFTYHGTTKRTMQIIRILKRCGIHVRSIEKIAYYETPEVKRTKFTIRRNARHKGNVCYAVLTQEMCEKCGITPQKALRLVNALAVVHGSAHTYALFVYFAPDQINVELRSNKGYPVHGVAKSFGGGGHRYASGCTIDPNVTPIDEVIEAMRKLRRDEHA